VLTLFIPLIMSSGGNSGSQATSLLVRALAFREPESCSGDPAAVLTRLSRTRQAVEWILPARC
jgi:Mg/Co/Ni transporter MgtE